MFGYMPANQFNVDLCLDTISVLNRTKREGQGATPYEMFSGDDIDYESDFRCRWGELVIVKKPKGISSDLRVTGEWALSNPLVSSSLANLACSDCASELVAPP